MSQENRDLSKEQKKILFESGTEDPFTDKLLKDYSTGIYLCVNCKKQLFNSGSKYESTEPGLVGWPSFNDSIKGSIVQQEDNSDGMRRTEVVCSKCKGHLGHVFPANDSSTGVHFCINSLALDFVKD